MAVSTDLAPQALIVRAEQPLIGIPTEANGHRIVHCLTNESEADADGTAEESGATALAGAWSHMDWDDLAESLDRIRHESEPTPTTFL